MSKSAGVNKMLKILEQTVQVRNARYDQDVDMPRGPMFTLLVGAGFSVTAGLSTVGHFILSLEKFKKERTKSWNNIFDETKGLSLKDRNLTAPELTDYYFKLIEDVLPLPQARHDFITAAIQWASSRRVQINIESILLATLLIGATGGNIPLDKRKSKRHWMAKAFARHVFTTNFDEVLPTTFYLGNAPVEILDNDKNVNINVAAEYPTVIYLHGRHLHYKIRNTKKELHRIKVKHLEQDLFQGFRNVLRNTGLIVIGYAGAEDKVSEIIKEAVDDQESLPYGLWWSVYQDEKSSVHPDIRNMIHDNDRCFFLEPGKDAEQVMRSITRGVGINDGDAIGIWKNRLSVIGNEVNRFIERATYDFHKFNVSVIQSLIFLDDSMLKKVESQWQDISEHLFEHEDQNLIVDILPRVGQVLIETGNFESSSEVYHLLFDLFNKRGELEKLANSYLEYSEQLIYSGKYTESKKIINLAHKIYNKSKSKVGLAQCLHLLANIEWITGNWETTEKNLSRSLKYSKVHNYKLGVANYHTGVGRVYYSKKNYKKSLKYFKEALELHKLDGNERFILSDIRGIAKCYIKLSDKKEASAHLDIALAQSKELNNKREIAHSLLVFGKFFAAFSSKYEALKMFNEAKEIFNTYIDHYGIAETEKSISELNFHKN